MDKREEERCCRTSRLKERKMSQETGNILPKLVKDRKKRKTRNEGIREK